METQMNPIETFLLAVMLTLTAMVFVQGLVMGLIWLVEKVITWWDHYHPVEEEVTLPMYQQLEFSTNVAYEAHLGSIPDDNEEEGFVQVLLNLNVEEDAPHVNQDEDNIPKRAEPFYEAPIEEHPRSSSAPEYSNSNNDDDRSSCESCSYSGGSCDDE